MWVKGCPNRADVAPGTWVVYQLSNGEKVLDTMPDADQDYMDEGGNILSGLEIKAYIVIGSPEVQNG